MLSKEIIRKKPDIIFLIVRSAVPAGVVYKTFIEEVKKMAEQEGKNDMIQASKKIPMPKFLLADAFIYREEGKYHQESFDKAVKKYEDKLQNFQYIAQRKGDNSPIRIGVFDESKNSGLGLDQQTKAVAEAAANTLLDSNVFSFDYPTSGGSPRDVPPKIPLPISYIPKSGDSLPLLEKKDEESFCIISGGVHSRWKHLYEQQSIQLAKNTAKLVLKWRIDHCGSLRDMLEEDGYIKKFKK